MIDPSIVVSTTGNVSAGRAPGLATIRLKGQGFDAIIGWDILFHCHLVCDGINSRFVLTF